MKLPVALIDGRSPADLSAGAVATRRDENAKLTPVQLDGGEHAERRKRMIAAVAVEDPLDAYERYIGSNDLLPVNYLLIGYQQSRAVGRISYFDQNEGRDAVATGFLVSDRLLMTNRHVFPVDDLASFNKLVRKPTVEFNYEFDVDGDRPDPVVFDLDSDALLYTFKPLV